MIADIPNAGAAVGLGSDASAHALALDLLADARAADIERRKQKLRQREAELVAEAREVADWLVVVRRAQVELDAAAKEVLFR